LLEGDTVEVIVSVGADSSLVVRTVAATLAHACPRGGETAVDVRVDAASGARVMWLPEPLVAHAGCRHRSTAHVDLPDRAAAVWRRHGPPFSTDSLLRRPSAMSPDDVHVHDRHGPEAKRALEREAALPHTAWEAEVARGLELGLQGADSIVDRNIPTFSRGEL